MKHYLKLICLGIVVLFVSCTSHINKNSEEKKSDDIVRVSYINPNDDQAQSLLKRGAKITKLATMELSTALKKAIKEEGPEYALDFCQKEATKITDSLSSSEGVIIKRLAKKNRNPNNSMNDMESKIYKQYIIEWLSSKTQNPKLAINENGHPVYYKPIRLNTNCLICHGKPGENIPENIARKISELYPEDKAINFEVGQPRGMWSITFTNVNADIK